MLLKSTGTTRVIDDDNLSHQHHVSTSVIWQAASANSIVSHAAGCPF
ncbi:hypothetical protein GTH32_03420 [Alteromonas sp. 345S023]|uniref:Uncharacterized protein n=1 Tax=Alteromonas profundi TaxID=2696062 RepID=A0A7X5RJS9_9ALTE|nr:hypothetical protein [Alteromonas profundi]NDV90243.1 hypothetical protein [Alteromonas profundi]